MKKTKTGLTHFFVDESGDPTFYDRFGHLTVGQGGCSPLLILGVVEIEDPAPARQAILNLQSELINDPYFSDIPSIHKTSLSFHAKDDLPEIRYRFFKLLSTLDFQAQFVVARKIEKYFVANFHSKENEFYDNLVTRLFEGKLHKREQNYIYYSKRGSRTRQEPIRNAIQKSIAHFEKKWETTITSNITIQAQTPSGEPCLSIVDYMNWAVYRAYTRREMRYYEAVKERVSFLLDLYDKEKYPNNFYHKRNPFDVNKITPL